MTDDINSFIYSGPINSISISEDAVNRSTFSLGAAQSEIIQAIYSVGIWISIILMVMIGKIGDTNVEVWEVVVDSVILLTAVLMLAAGVSRYRVDPSQSLANKYRARPVKQSSEK